MPWAPALTEQQRRDTPQDSVERVTSAIRTIRPCSGTVDDHGRTAPNMFHLLDCGHVVVIDGSDTRCGSNCRYPINGANPQFSETLVKSPTAPRLISILPTDFRPRQEPLYCEVCQGIPVDHYLFQKYRRRSLALTRGEIVAALQIPNDLVDAILAAPFPNPDLQEHNLQCGHKVYCVAQQPCGQNCESDKPCPTHPLALLLNKDSGVIFCQECVLRAERLYTRYEAKEKELEVRRRGYPGPGAEFGF